MITKKKFYNALGWEKTRSKRSVGKPVIRNAVIRLAEVFSYRRYRLGATGER